MSFRYIALLRGINVGGKHKLPMKALVALFEAQGARNVRSYIQSGNVLFDASAQLAKQLTTAIPKAIETDFGFAAPIVLRAHDDVRVAFEKNPWLAEGRDPSHLHLGFLPKTPRPALVKALDPHRSPTDGFRIMADHVYLHIPGGMAKTKLTTSFFDRGLATTMTVRNWKTVTKLIELSAP